MFLQKHVEDGVGASGRTACDRIIRACNQRLGGGAPEPELQERLVDLVELATQGYGSATEPGAQGSSLYLEKIIFHILQKLVTHGAHAAAGRLGEFMYLRLLAASSEVWARTRLLKGRSDTHYSNTVKHAGLYGGVAHRGGRGSQRSGGSYLGMIYRMLTVEKPVLSFHI